MTDGFQTEPTKPPVLSLKHWLVLALVALLAILIDQASKAYVVAHLDLHESWMPISFIDSFFRITRVHNTGVAFGMFPNGGVIFLIIPVVVSLIIVYYYRQLTTDAWLVRIALGLQMGGAFGNLIDRLRQGYVVDFLHLEHWPVSNVSDICIVSGVILLGFEMLREERQNAQTSREAAKSSEMN